LPINTNAISDRKTFSYVGRQSYLNIDGKGDVYVLLSPYAYIKETSKESADFSYPLDSIYYKLQNGSNQEGFSYNISSVSHDFVSNNVSISSVPQYRKTGLLLIDKYLYTTMSGVSDSIFLNVQTVGDYSEILDTFKINLVRAK